ncbi:hypothetical protein HPB51_003821 [Rhipicephalus microplus]|uniref:Protein XRP2 n=1 Tax=Rhipicephalus microplus TaxID=6941 RepID=A0A9J6ELI9_RHIMP|nr:hypothetical protein HPB51_003821 [Rhipicephalus microplus]
MGAVQRKLTMFTQANYLPREPCDRSKAYSWDAKPKVDASNYTVENAVDTTVTKCSGNVNGQQFVIRNCHNASLYILDHINSVTIDDCVNCNIVLGPTQGSVFLRNCNNVRLASACQQLRARDCSAVDSWLCCSTQPSIESCSEMRFGSVLGGALLGRQAAGQQHGFRTGHEGSAGPAVVFEYMGTNCRETCQQVAARLTSGTHYISPQEPETTKKQIEAAFNTTQGMFS